MKNDRVTPSCPRDEWASSERNCFSEEYDMEGKNRGLRLQLISDAFLSIVQAIIRPPRCIYSMSHLGPRELVFTKTDGRRVVVERNDYALEHDPVLIDRGTIMVSEFTPFPKKAPDSANPVIIYVHGNSSARIDVLHNGLLEAAASRGFSVIAFDTAGSGMSMGSEYVSLGFFEKLDLKLVVQWAHGADATWRKRPVAVWGFSQGAVATLLFASLRNDILSDSHYDTCALSGLVLDSPFSSLKALANEHPISKQIRGGIMALRVLFPLVRWRVRRRTGLDINKLDVVDAARNAPTNLPCFIIAAECDEIVPSSHGKAVHAAYSSINKEFCLLQGNRHDHNSPRPSETIDRALDFLEPMLMPPPGAMGPLLLKSPDLGP